MQLTMIFLLFIISSISAERLHSRYIIRQLKLLIYYAALLRVLKWMAVSKPTTVMFQFQLSFLT